MMFFFQAEDGIRDLTVTGVQTCALPISSAERGTRFENARPFVDYSNLQPVSGFTATYRRLLRREVVDICALIFIADVVTGVQTPLFPLYATSLGASLGLLGVITAVLGLGRLASALPI